MLSMCQRRGKQSITCQRQSINVSGKERSKSIWLKLLPHASNMKILYNPFFFAYGHMFKVSNMHMDHLKKL